jgi:predicted nucleic acid-binding protein
MPFTENATPVIVLDTNVVLDCLVFRDPGCAALVEWLSAGRLRWLASPAMRDELAHVLARGHLAAWQPDPTALFATWDRWASPAAEGAPSRLHCTDPDDQKFIDAALTHRARWLLSRDRAVLKLARAARATGLAILTPLAWTRAVGGATPDRPPASAH